MQDDKQLKHLKNIINVDDMAEVIEYLHREKGWSYYDSYASCKLYKNYLYLLAKYKRIFPPSYEMNQVWLAHILIEPEDYQKMCYEIFDEDYQKLATFKQFYRDNKFISALDKDNFENITVDLYFKEFKKKINDFYAKRVGAVIRDKLAEYKLSVGKIVSTVAIPLLVFLWVSSVGHHNDLIRTAHVEIQKAMVQVSQKFEDRHMVCQFTLTDKKNPNYVRILYDFNQMLAESLVRLISLTYQAYADELITKELLKSLSSFNKKYDAILHATEPYICSGKIQDPEEALQERIKMTADVKKSEEKLQTGVFGVKIINKHEVTYSPEGFGIH